MKNRTSLVLMELLVMVLVFSLASAACLGLFARADRISRETEQRSAALAIVQNGAETLKATGSLEGAAEALGAVREDSLWTVDYIEEAVCFRLEMEPLSGAPSGLGQAELRVCGEDGTVLACLTVAWQEVA